MFCASMVQSNLMSLSTVVGSCRGCTKCTSERAYAASQALNACGHGDGVLLVTEALASATELVVGAVQLLTQLANAVHQLSLT